MGKWNPFKTAKKVLKKVSKPFRKISKKFIPRELRWMAPYLAAATPYTSFMYPGSGIFSGNVGRGFLSSLYNVAGQGIADPEGEDINLLSTLLAGGQGALTGQGAGQGLRDMTTKGKWGIGSVPDQISGVPANVLQDRSFLTKAKDLGLTGLAEAADYLGGARETLGALGAGEEINLAKAGEKAIMADLFTKGGAKKGLMAASPIFTQGTGDVFKAEGDKALREFEKQEAADAAEIEATSTANEGERATLQMTFMRQAGHDEETIKETLDMNDLGDYYEPPGAAYGGIIGLRNGGRIGYIHGGVIHPDGRRGFFKGAEKDARAGRAAMSPGTSVSGGMRSGFGGTGNTGTGTTTTTPITKTIKTSITPTTNWADTFKGWFGMGDDDDTSLESLANKVTNFEAFNTKNQLAADIAAEFAAKEFGLNDGGIVGLKHGGMLNLGGNEMDYRGGGFVPIGKRERADDVPARLSKNEFVMTADAVKAAGGGSVNKGAQRMYDVMNNLEARA